jgi:UDP-N-acetyl-D-mannosaminuronic acid dehydrogenase
VQAWFDARGPKIDVTVCPERVAQGKGYLESKTLPQIISGFSDRGRAAARFFFERLGVEIVDVEPLEAELIKLFNNVYRYVTFAVANQFFTIANDYGIDYYRIHHGLTHHYPRGASLPAPGFAAGPCLFKDTMQLASFANNRFFLGHSAMLVNEGLPLYVVQQLEKRHDLSRMTVGILGLAFKANCDDVRDSLAFKLRKILKIRARKVLCADSRINREHVLRHVESLHANELVDTDALIEKSDVIVVGVPHSEYRSVDLKGKPVIDIWNMLGKGARL